MRIGVPREMAPGERRVALVPEVVGRLCGASHEVIVQRQAGAGAMIPDAQFEQAGARLVEDAGSALGCEVVVKVAPPSRAEIEMLSPGAC